MDALSLKKQPKIGLALSGGAALGIAHIGALQCLEDHNVKITSVVGTSAGSLVAACLAFGIPAKELAERSKNLSWFKLTNLSRSLMGLITSQGIGNMINEILGDVKIENAKIPLAIVATDIETGEPVIFKKGSVSDAIMASVCIPGIFSPVEINGRYLSDGGLVKNLPISLLNDMGAEIKIGVNLARWRKYKKPGNLIDVMLNSLDILTHKQTNQDALLADVIIEPHLENYSASDFKKAAELINEGYRATSLRIPNIMEKLSGESKLTSKPQNWWQKIFTILK